MPKVTIPQKLLQLAEGSIITIELKCRDVYRGQLVYVEDENWNCQLKDVTLTTRKGQVKSLETAFIRGSQIHYMILPDMLKHDDMFKKVAPAKPAPLHLRGIPPGRGRGRGLVPSKKGLYLFFLYDKVDSHVQLQKYERKNSKAICQFFFVNGECSSIFRIWFYIILYFRNCDVKLVMDESGNF